MSYTRFVTYSLIPLLLLASGLLEHDLIVLSVIGGIAELFVIARMLDRRRDPKHVAAPSSVDREMPSPPPVPPPAAETSPPLNLPVQPEAEAKLTQAEASSNVSPRPARPWPRYWARMLDITLFTYVLAVVVGVVCALLASANYPNFLHTLANPIAAFLFFWALMPLSMLLDAAIYSLFGNTPGKALLGIKVRGIDGTRLRFGVAVRRNFGVFWRGLAAGVPLVGLFTLAHAYEVVKAGKPSSWDTATASETTGHAKGYRTWVGALAYFALLIAWQESNKLSAEEQKLDDIVTNAITAINSMAPKAIDDETRLDGAEAGPGTAFTYLYTLPNIDSRTSQANEQFRSQMLRTLRSNYCQGEALKRFRNAGLAIHYKYRDRNGLLFTEFAVHPGDCR